MMPPMLPTGHPPSADEYAPEPLRLVLRDPRGLSQALPAADDADSLAPAVADETAAVPLVSSLDGEVEARAAGHGEYSTGHGWRHPLAVGLCPSHQLRARDLAAAANAAANAEAAAAAAALAAERAQPEDLPEAADVDLGTPYADGAPPLVDEPAPPLPAEAPPSPPPAPTEPVPPSTEAPLPPPAPAEAEAADAALLDSYAAAEAEAEDAVAELEAAVAAAEAEDEAEGVAEAPAPAGD